MPYVKCLPFVLHGVSFNNTFNNNQGIITVLLLHVRKLWFIQIKKFNLVIYLGSNGIDT